MSSVDTSPAVTHEFLYCVRHAGKEVGVEASARKGMRAAERQAGQVLTWANDGLTWTAGDWSVALERREIRTQRHGGAK